MSIPSHPNPYEPPRTPNEFRDEEPQSDVADLRQRIAELERRVSRSWMVHPNVFFRIVAVWGHFILGYGILLAIWGIVMLGIFLVTYMLGIPFPL